MIMYTPHSDSRGTHGHTNTLTNGHIFTQYSGISSLSLWELVYREQENNTNAEAMATQRLDPVYRIQEKVTDMEWRSNALTNPERREEENYRSAEALATRCLDPVRAPHGARAYP